MSWGTSLCPTSQPAAETRSAGEHHRALSWAQRLKRALNVDIETCARGGGVVKVIACIEDPAVIKTIVPPPAQRPPRERVWPMRLIASQA